MIRVSLWHVISSSPSLQLHLYHNQKDFVYDHVFVRIVCDLDARATAAQRSCSGTAETASITIANPSRNSKPITYTDA